MTDRVKQLKENYPPGTRLELLHMDDPFQPVPDGTKGTVKFVDDDGQLHMTWDNGRTLAVNTEVDTIRKLTMDEIAEEEIAKGHEVVNLGDDCQIVLPDEPVDCSSLGYFDELEEECWDLVKSYCSRLGIKMIHMTAPFIRGINSEDKHEGKLQRSSPSRIQGNPQDERHW